MRDTRRAAEYLFDEIGGIDDSYIAAAQSARPVRVRRPSRVVLIAAAAVLVMSMAVALPMSLRTDGDMANDDAFTSPTGDGTMNAADNYSPSAPEQEKPQSAFALDAVLNSTVYSFYMGETPDLFDGTPRLLWQSDGGELCGVSLDGVELDRLDELKGKGEQIGATALEANVKVWISYGNGLVVSPYLEDSPGNVGYGELFDYSPEIIPSSAVTGYISNIIAKQT